MVKRTGSPHPRAMQGDRGYHHAAGGQSGVDVQLRWRWCQSTREMNALSPIPPTPSVIISVVASSDEGAVKCLKCLGHDRCHLIGQWTLAGKLFRLCFND